jgi:ribosomal-protein-alanine N-acetyltransferase
MALRRRFAALFHDRTLGEDRLVEVEPYALEHVPAVLTLERTCFPAPWSLELLRQEAAARDHAWNLVAFVDEDLAAYLFNWIVLDEMHLLNFAVAPALQGRGLGGFLLDWMLAEAARNGYHMLSLEVRESNAAARDYTDHGEDALLMARSLDPAGGA